MNESIDSLELQINTSSKEAEKGIDALTTSLEKLKDATKGGLGLTSVINQLDRVGNSTKSINSTSISNLNGLAKAIQILSGVGNVKISSSIASQISAIGVSAQGLNGVNFTPITQLANALTPLSTMGKINLGSVVNQLNRIPELTISLQTVDTTGFTTKIKEIVSSLQPLSALGKTNLSSTLNAIKKIPEVFNSLLSVNIGAFASKIKELTAALKPLATEMEKVSKGFSAFPSKVQKTIASTNNLSTSNNKSVFSFLNLATKITTVIAVVKLIGSKIASYIKLTNDYIENVNLFNASMGKYAAEAQTYAEQVGETMGIDPGEWMRNQGVFMTLATGFGVASDKANIMSKNLTQLGYDLSSFFNISYEDSMQKLQSGLSGELEPLRRLGYDLSQAKLQSVALSLGIDKSITSMNQAEKSQLRYHAIMTQVTTVQGDMARTLNAPANQTRILTAQITQAGRAIGSIFIPALNAILPYAIAVVKVIRKIAEEVALLVGFKIPEIDYSNIESVAGGTEDASNALDDAAKSAKKLQSYTLGFDELNVINPNDSSGSGSDISQTVTTQFDFELPEYDFLGDAIESRTKGIEENITKFLDKIKNSFSGAFDSVKKSFGVFKEQFSKVDWLTTFENLFVSGFGAIGQTIDTVTSSISPFFEALNVPEIVSKSLESITSLFDNSSLVLEKIKPGLAVFSEKFLAPIGEWFNEFTTDSIDEAIGWFDKIGQWFSDNEETINSFLSALGGVSGAVWSVVEAVLGLSADKSWSDISDGLDTILSVVDLILPIISSILNVIEIIIRTVVILFDILTLNFEDIPTQLEAIGVAGSELWENIKSIFTNAWDWIKEKLQKAYNKVYEIGSWISEKALPFIKGVLSKIAGFFLNLWKKIREVWYGVANWFNEKVIKPIVNFFSPIVKWVGDIFKGLWLIIKAVWIKVSTWFNEKVIQPIVNFFAPIVIKVSNFFLNLWKKIREVWYGVANWFNEKVIQPIVDFFRPIIEKIGKFFSDLWGNIKKIWINVANWFMNHVVKPLVVGFTYASDFISGGFNGILSGIEWVINKVIDGINGLTAGFDKIVSWAADVLGTEWSGITKIEHVSLVKYANGGFPTTGQMFVARERGAELVGNIGSRSAVMNNDQIIESVSTGVYQAVATAFGDNGNNEGTQNIVINLDGEKIYENQQKVARNRGYNLGMGAFSFG